MTAIQPIVKKFLCDYGQEKITNFWQKKSCQKSDSPHLQHIIHQDYLETMLNILFNAQKVVCLATENLESEELCKALLKKAQEGVRIYLLLRKVTTENRKYIEILASQCLIRVGYYGIGSYLLTDPKEGNRQGCLFTEPLLRENLLTKLALLVKFNAIQISEMFQHFLLHFWEQSTHEILEKNDLDNLRKVPSSPVASNNVLPDHLISERLCQIFANPQNTWMYLTNIAELPFIDWRTFQKTMIITSLLGNHTPSIAILAGNNSAKIYAYDAQEPATINFIGLGNQVYLFPKRTLELRDKPYFLKLSNEQSQEIKRLWSYLQNKICYRFITQENLANIHSSIRFQNNLEHEITIPDDLSEDLGDWPSLAEIRDLQTAKPEELCQDVTKFNLSKHFTQKMNFSVTLHPPYLPNGAKRDSLYDEWESLDKNYQQQIQIVSNRISEIQKKKESLSKKILGFLSGLFTGKEQQAKEIENELQNLRPKKLFAIKKQERINIIQKINEMLKNLERSKQDVEEEIDRTQQEQEWKEKREELCNDLASFEKNWEDKKQDLEKLEDDFITKEKEMKKKYEEDKERLKKEHCLSLEQEEKEHNIALDKIKKQQEINKEKSKEESKSKDNPKSEIDSRNTQYEDNKKTLENRYKTKLDEAEKKYTKDYQHSQKLKDNAISQKKEDIESLQKKIDRKRSEIQKHGERFFYQPKIQQKTKISAMKSLEDDEYNDSSDAENIWNPKFPKEELPKSGELFCHNKQRYLVIKDWEKLELGEQEAQSLKAKLCTNRN